MELTTSRRVSSLALLFTVALVGCSSKKPTGWTNETFYSQPGLISYQPSESHVEIAPNSSAQVTVRFKCVQPGQFSGNVLLIHDDSLEAIEAMTEEEKAQFEAERGGVPALAVARKDITALHISVP